MFGWGNRGSYKEEKLLLKEKGNDSYILEELDLITYIAKSLKKLKKTTTPKFAGGQGDRLHVILKQFHPLLQEQDHSAK